MYALKGPSYQYYWIQEKGSVNTPSTDMLKERIASFPSFHWHTPRPSFQACQAFGEFPCCIWIVIRGILYYLFFINFKYSEVLNEESQIPETSKFGNNYLHRRWRCSKCSLAKIRFGLDFTVREFPWICRRPTSSQEIASVFFPS